MDKPRLWRSVVLGGLTGKTLAVGAYCFWKPGTSIHLLFLGSSEHFGGMTLGPCLTPAYGPCSPTFPCPTFLVEQDYGAPKGNQVVDLTILDSFVWIF